MTEKEIPREEYLGQNEEKDWKQKIEKAKEKMRKLIQPRPTDSCLATRMFNFVDWFGSLAEEHFKRDPYYKLKCSQIDSLHKENVKMIEEISRLKAEIVGIREIIAKNVADEGLEALLQIKINELKKEASG